MREPAPRRSFLKAAAGTSLAALAGASGAQSFDFKPNQRYPDSAVQILDPSFAKYRIYSSTLELTFGGPKNNRLYMASCHSVYALYVEAHGAV